MSYPDWNQPVRTDIKVETVTVTTTGIAGAAVGSGVTPLLKGFLLEVVLDYNAACPATADVTIAFTTVGGNLLVVTNSATDGTYAPRRQVCDVAGAGVAGAYDLIPLDGQSLTISVADADALDPCLTAYLRILQ